MNDSYRDSLQILITNPTLMAAVKVVFSEAVESEVPKSANGDNNFVLGEKFRAYEAAKKMIDEAFRGMERLRKPEREKEGDTMHI